MITVDSPIHPWILYRLGRPLSTCVVYTAVTAVMESTRATKLRNRCTNLVIFLLADRKTLYVSIAVTDSSRCIALHRSPSRRRPYVIPTVSIEEHQS